MKNKRILITGGRGFLGSHVVSNLASHGYKKLLPAGHRECDLTSKSAVENYIRRTKPHAIIHLAARVGGIEANRRNPGLFFYQNLIMGTQLMEAARLFGVQKFVGIGTVCSYPKFTPVPFKEKDLWNGYPEATNAPYGLAKKMLLVQGQSYRLQYALNAVYLIPVNLYGPRDDFDLQSGHVIPALIRKFSEARSRGRREVTLWGDGRASREFLYVEDCARAIRLALEKYNGAEPVNIGTGKEISIKNLASLIQNLVGFKGQIRWDRAKPNGQPRRCLDVSRAKKFGFKAKTPLEEGLRKTILWYSKAFR